MEQIITVNKGGTRSRFTQSQWVCVRMVKNRAYNMCFLFVYDNVVFVLSRCMPRGVR